MRKNSKQKKQEQLEIVVNGEKFNLGYLVTTTKGYCPVTKRKLFSYKCNNIGKTFTNVKLLSKHLAEYLVSSGKVILNK